MRRSFLLMTVIMGAAVDARADLRGIEEPCTLLGAILAAFVYRHGTEPAAHHPHP